MTTRQVADSIVEVAAELRRHGAEHQARAIEELVAENTRLRAFALSVQQLAAASAGSDSAAERRSETLLVQPSGVPGSAQPPTYLPSAAARRAPSPPPALGSLDLLTSTEAGDLVGVTGQTIKNWVKDGRMKAYRVGNRIMVPRSVVEDYVREAGTLLELEEVTDEEAARLVNEARRKHP
jgi:excisionase family DNA binding protein